MSESRLKINLGLLLFIAAWAATFSISEARAANPISCDYLFGNGNGGKSDLTFKLDATAGPKVDFGSGCSVKISAAYNEALKKAQQACVNSMILWQRHQANSQGAELPAEIAGCPCPECQLATKQVTSLVNEGTNVGGYLSTLNNGGYYSLNSHEVEADLKTQIDALKSLQLEHKNTGRDDSCSSFDMHAEAAIAELSASNARLASIRGESAVPKGADLSKTGNFWKNYDSQYGEAGMTDAQANSYAGKLENSSDPMKKQVGNMIQVAQNLDNPNQKNVADQLQLAIMYCQPDAGTPIVNDGIVAKRTIARIRSLMEKDPGAYGKCLKDVGASDIPEVATAGGGSNPSLGAAATKPADAPPGSSDAHSVQLAQLGPNAVAISEDGQTVTCSLRSQGRGHRDVKFSLGALSSFGNQCPSKPITDNEAYSANQAAAKAKFGDGFVSIGPNHLSNEGDLITCQVKNPHTGVVGPEIHPDSTLKKWYPEAGGKCPPLSASGSATPPAAPVAPGAGAPATGQRAPADALPPSLVQQPSTGTSQSVQPITAQPSTESLSSPHFRRPLAVRLANAQPFTNQAAKQFNLDPPVMSEGGANVICSMVNHQGRGGRPRTNTHKFTQADLQPYGGKCPVEYILNYGADPDGKGPTSTYYADPAQADEALKNIRVPQH